MIEESQALPVAGRAEWMTIAYAADRLGVSRQAVWKRIARLDLPTWKVSSKHVLIQIADVKAWENARRETGRRA